MDSAAWEAKDSSNAVVTTAGMASTARLHWRKTAKTAKIMTKVTASVCLIIGISFNDVLPPDGLTDCEDPECCSQAACSTHQLCVSAPKPIDILLRKQPPAITASFFERMKFLIDEGSLQNYAKMETFNER